MEGEIMTIAQASNLYPGQWLVFELRGSGPISSNSKGVVLAHDQDDMIATRTARRIANRRRREGHQRGLAFFRAPPK